MKGESQRIYWQQWLSSASGSHNSRRELITSSAAIRISPDSAKAKDVTKLLRDTLNLSSLKSSDADKDALVLVGTLYSLPRDYIQFEHEPQHESQSQFVQKQQENATTYISSSQSDPFHVVKTLSPEDNPLHTRDKMMEHLRRIRDGAPAGRSTISPKVQWYFVPSGEYSATPSPIPSCIELDGYCTSMEEEEFHDDSDNDEESLESSHYETDSMDQTLLEDSELLLSRCPFLKPTSQAMSLATVENGCQGVTTAADRRQQFQQNQEVRRYTQLSQSRFLHDASCICGYLLKQSKVDPHVWRKVHCVLTDDHLWYVTRIPYSPSSSRNFPRMGQNHCRISLGRALVLEPNAEYTRSPLYRIPNAFEVVSSRGVSHVFRAHNRTLQRHWIQALSTKIMESFENSLMSHAELIVADESIARNKRLEFIAVKPLFCHDQSKESLQYGEHHRTSILRLGMDISKYRERCRHVQAILPAKQPVVVLSESSMKIRASDPPPEPPVPEPLDPETKQLVEATWNHAESLLAQANQVAVEVQTNGTKSHMSRSLETNFRHIDYVITRKHRQLSSKNGFEEDKGSSPKKSEELSPPPMNLFDSLLDNFQTLVLPSSGKHDKG